MPVLPGFDLDDVYTPALHDEIQFHTIGPVGFNIITQRKSGLDYAFGHDIFSDCTHIDRIILTCECDTGIYTVQCHQYPCIIQIHLEGILTHFGLDRHHWLTYLHTEVSISRIMDPLKSETILIRSSIAPVTAIVFIHIGKYELLIGLRKLSGNGVEACSYQGLLLG